MTDDTEENQPKNRRASVMPATIPEEPNSKDTIEALIDNNPLAEPSTIPTSTTTTVHRTRRRSSFSILQYVNGSHSLPTNVVRTRNFLVGSRQTSEDGTHGMSSCFPNGRLLTIMMVTWNTGEAPKLYEQNYTPTATETKQQKDRMLNDMSDIFLPTFSEYVSDLIIVCTQEMYVTKKRIDWEILLQEVIGPTHVLYHSIHFGTLSLCIFLRRDLIWFCTEPEEDIIKFRAVGPIRTKGSLVITFNLFGTSFMIINSHFEAGDGPDGRANRRLNFQNTISKLRIPYEFFQRTVIIHKHVTEPARTESLKRIDSTKSLDSEPRALLDVTKSCDCVLWAGDMNFRVDMSHQEVLGLCTESNYDQILLKDEFRTLQKQLGDLYKDFKEANIEFPPTYKFDLSHSVDTYAKNRTPSYTDRILFRHKPTSVVECTKYTSVENVRHSDHKPVVAHFHVKLKPGLHTGNLSYGKFNRDVYQRGCEQREKHGSLDIPKVINKRTNTSPSAVCVLL